MLKAAAQPVNLPVIDGRAAVRLTLAGVVLGTAPLAVAIGSIRGPSWGSAAVIGMVVTPLLLALASIRFRPELLVVASILYFVGGFFIASVLIVLFPFPAILFLVAATKALGGQEVSLRNAVGSCAAITLGILAPVALLVHQDPYCSTQGSTTTCGSDSVVAVEGLAALALDVGAVAVGIHLTKRPHPPPKIAPPW